MAGDERTETAGLSGAAAHEAEPDPTLQTVVLSAPIREAKPWIPGERSDRARLARLAASPETHHVFRALRLIEAVCEDRPRLGRSTRPREDWVRLGQEAELAFPTSSLASFRMPQDGKPAKLVNRFFGIFGPQGPMPLHITEYARDRQRNWRDPTLVAFADLFHHRFLSLFYRAWATAEPAPSFDRKEDDPFAEKIAAIGGFYGRSKGERDAMPDLAKLHFAGLLGQTQRNEAGLIAIVSAFFKVPVQIESFVGTWLHLEPGDRWELGRRARFGGGARLGGSTSLGSRVWSRQAKFRFRIGPLSLANYERLLPGGESLARLSAIVRNYLGDAFEWEANLVLRESEVPETRLGSSGRLGLTTWIGRRPAGRDADELYLLPPGAA